MKPGCICYVTDRNYLFITLVSAMQARAQVASSRADVLLLAIDDGPEIDTYRRICDREGIVFLNVAARAEAVLKDALGDIYRTGFAGRISAATLVRLVISDFVTGDYGRMLYIDGDTQINGSLDILLQRDLPAGRFLAARDYTSVMRSAGFAVPDRFSPNFQRLGVPEARRNYYFNAGVIVSDFEDWKTIGRNALAYFADSGGTLQFHDQDALNGACWEQHLPLSNRWNFPRQFLHLRARLSYQPEIVHFMANPKPWHGVLPPWGKKEYGAYREVIDRYPELAGDIPTLSPARFQAYRLKSTYYDLRDRLQVRRNGRIAAILDEQFLDVPHRAADRPPTSATPRLVTQP
ncbi:glycosyltransferase [Methylobacterium sp. EM32]|uniref:glycosyltransferase family 8 protein n=1 Tax=Methylobacterium sp. EM32 TaxID=3163481 RepID=UPI0033B79158